jgi:hypothetical protein
VSSVVAAGTNAGPSDTCECARACACVCVRVLHLLCSSLRVLFLKAANDRRK